jgi:hypothetical protein
MISNIEPYANVCSFDSLYRIDFTCIVLQWDGIAIDKRTVHGEQREERKYKKEQTTFWRLEVNM